MPFGTGPKSCPGKGPAMAELTAMLIVLGREVERVAMAPEEQRRWFTMTAPHPTGMPLKLFARQSPTS